jgi:hypothetical protein
MSSKKAAGKQKAAKASVRNSRNNDVAGDEPVGLGEKATRMNQVFF